MAEIHRRQRAFFRAQVRRKLGGQPDASCPPPRKRRRVKTYVSTMMVDNILRTSAGCRLTDFLPPKSEDGQLVGSPFQWRSLALATDSGPDMAGVSAARGLPASSARIISCFPRVAPRSLGVHRARSDIGARLGRPCCTRSSFGPSTPLAQVACLPVGCVPLDVGLHVREPSREWSPFDVSLHMVRSGGPASLLRACSRFRRASEVSMHHFLLAKGFNIEVNYDPSHWLSNASKGALRTAACTRASLCSARLPWALASSVSGAFCCPRSGVHAALTRCRRSHRRLADHGPHSRQVAPSPTLRESRGRPFQLSKCCSEDVFVRPCANSQFWCVSSVASGRDRCCVAQSQRRAICFFGAPFRSVRVVVSEPS